MDGVYRLKGRRQTAPLQPKSNRIVGHGLALAQTLAKPASAGLGLAQVRAAVTIRPPWHLPGT